MTPDTQALEEANYVLLSRDLYWRTNGCGYTGIKAHAGKHSKTVAEEHSRHFGNSALLFDEAPMFSARCDPYVKADYLEQNNITLIADNERLQKSLKDERAEKELMQDILDSRPAINSEVTDKYIKWSQAIYSGDFARNAAKAIKGE